MTNAPAWEHIAVTYEEDVLELRFHTDDAALVWSSDAHREATEAFAWAETQTGMKVLIITGSGRAFCDELETEGFSKLAWDHVWWEGRRLLRHLNEIEIPVIGVVNGPALIHAEIPLMGDIVLCSPDAVFGDHAHFPFHDTVPGDGVQLIWTELLGPTRAKYMLLTGATVDSSEALRLGLVNEVIDRPRLNERAWEIARTLARRSVPTLRYAKSVVSMGTRVEFTKSLSYGLALEGGGYMVKGGLGSLGHSGE